MYAFLDRPVAELDPASRVLLWAMRTMVSAVRVGRCPCSGLHTAFRGWRLGGLLPDFQGTMQLLDRAHAVPLRFRPVPASGTGDDEALLLSLFAAARRGDAMTVGAIAGHVVHAEAQHDLTIAAGRIATHFVAWRPAPESPLG